MCVGLFYSQNAPDSSSYAGHQHVTPGAGRRGVPMPPALGETQWRQAESQGTSASFHFNVELLFLPQERC